MQPAGARATVPSVMLAGAVLVLGTASPLAAPGEEDAVLLGKLEEGGYSRRGADTCLGCHDEEEPFPTLELFRAVHGHPAVHGSPFEMESAVPMPAGLQCEACHGPIGEHGERFLDDGASREAIINFGARGNASSELQNGMCLQCHATYERAHWSGSAHEAAGLACADCHRIHSADDPVRTAAGQNAACTTCHRGVAMDALKLSAHPMAESQLVCRDCHDPHGTSGEALAVRPTTNETCLTCHADLRGPFLWEHPPAAEDCLVCHVPHGANQPSLLVRRAPQLCQGCHSSVGHRSLPQLPSGPPSAFLLANACLNCHSEVHGSNHPSGQWLRR